MTSQYHFFGQYHDVRAKSNLVRHATNCYQVSHDRKPSEISRSLKTQFKDNTLKKISLIFFYALQHIQGPLKLVKDTCDGFLVSEITSITYVKVKTIEVTFSKLNNYCKHLYF